MRGGENALIATKPQSGDNALLETSSTTVTRIGHAVVDDTLDMIGLGSIYDNSRR
jgi:hypothetical protein